MKDQYGKVKRRSLAPNITSYHHFVLVMTFGMTMMQWWCVTTWNWIPHGQWPQERVPLVTGELFTSWMMFIARDQKRNWSIVPINFSMTVGLERALE